MSPDEVTRMFKSVQEIKDILLGTYKEKGMITKVESHETWINRQRRGREGLFNYTYKIAIMIVLGYIAMKLGLK